MPPQTVKKAQRAFLTGGLNDGRSAAPVMRGVISDVHAAGNDRFDFVSAIRGGNSAKLFCCKQVL